MFALDRGGPRLRPVAVKHEFLCELFWDIMLLYFHADRRITHGNIEGKHYFVVV